MSDTESDFMDIMNYIDKATTAVVSTINDDGTPQAAVVYIVAGSDHTAYFVTKDSTRKYQNILKRPQVSLTMYNERDTSTLQVIGEAFTSDMEHMISYVLDRVKKEHAIRAEWLPPVTKLRDGKLKIVGVKIIHARIAEYAGVGVGGPKFTVV